MVVSNENKIVSIAQSVERTPFKRVVVGSSPTSGEGGKGRPSKVPQSGNGETVVALIIYQNK